MTAINIREIFAQSPEELAREFDSLNVDRKGIGIMIPKGLFHVLRLRNLKSPAANILKQEMLSIGGECAISRSVILGDPNPQDVIVMGTRQQIARLITRLRAQPFELKQVAVQLGAFIKRISDQAWPIDSLLLSLAGDLPHYPVIMGICNVTPDSFSDGGQYLEKSAAVSHAMTLFEQGAEIVDIGGESTRPGSAPVTAEEELRRIKPVLDGLRELTGKPLSVDTMKARVAKEALDAGASLINDVSGGRHDPRILEVVAESGCPFVLMHMQGEPKTMQQNPRYNNLMDELHRFFDESITRAVCAGVKEEQIIIDPGIGFGKRREDNYEILQHLRELRAFNRPVMVGISRKSFLQNDLSKIPQERLEETIAAGTIAMMDGADILRVHDVIPAIKARIVFQRLMNLA